MNFLQRKMLWFADWIFARSYQIDLLHIELGRLRTRIEKLEEDEIKRKNKRICGDHE